MKKRNNKGFTLIEMLVVIAVIAVLVSIIVPTISSATNKAAAATNAANLRSWKTSLATSYLAGETTVDAKGNVTPAANLGAAPVSVKCGALKKGVAPTVKYSADTNEFTVTYGENDIAAFAAVADGTAKADAIKAVTENQTASLCPDCGTALVDGICPNIDSH